MFYAWLILFSAVLISATSAWFSITGLTAIFSGAFIPVIVMGSVLELGKLVATSWVYKNRAYKSFSIKLYLTAVIIVLMLINSIGIFGFLSKAHLTKITSSQDKINTEVEEVTFKIKQTQEEETLLLTQKKLLDDGLTKYYELGYVTKALKKRDEQKQERDAIDNKVSELTKEISLLSKQKFELQQQINSINVEVGPIKYIAALLYKTTDASNTDKAIRILIITLIFVFDPLAVLLIIAGNISLEQAKGNKKPKKDERPQTIIQETKPSQQQEQEQKEVLKEEEEEVVVEPTIQTIDKEKEEVVEDKEEPILPKPEVDFGAVLNEAFYNIAQKPTLVPFNLNNDVGQTIKNELQEVYKKHNS